MSENIESPIFIGGTGRCGTTILSQILHQHPDLFTTSSELKLIVESYGLVSLSEHLTDRWNPQSGHIALEKFKYFANQLCHFGFINPFLRILGKLPLFKNHSWILKKFPSIRYSAHEIASRFGEKHFKKCIQELLNKLIYRIDISKPINTCGVWYPFYVTNKFERSDLLEIFRGFLRDLYSNPLHIYGKKRWCDDTPFNLMKAHFLLELYPRMKFIHILRDPRDVVASYSNQGWASNQVSINTHIITNLIKGWLDLRSKLSPENLLEIRLEDLTQDTERTVRKICEFTDLEFTTDLLTLDLTAGHAGRFKNELNNYEIHQIEVGLKDWMNEKDYLSLDSSVV
jgi:hypothetical protein